jgi:predicted acylesterase/phospholipase RssA
MTSSLNEKLQKDNKPKRILALDGGGIRGALTLGYLEKTESLLRDRYDRKDLVLSDYYDLIGGTSTGAIIASCLAIGKSVEDVIQLYKNFGKVVFGKQKFGIIPRDWTTFRALFKSSYSEKIIEELLCNNLKDSGGKEIELGDQKSVKCGLVINTKRADTYSLWTVANHPRGEYYEANKKLKLWELCRASSAAPYYFTPKKLRIKTRKGVEFDAAYIDGGVSLANNPALQLFLTATIPSFGFNWPCGEKNIFITSFGTGNGVKKDSVDEIINRRTISWAPKLSELFMTDALELNQVILQLFGRNYGPAEIVDSQYGDLKDVNYSNEKIFSFARCNVKMTPKYLDEELGMKRSEKEVNSLVEMDHYENIDELLEIGRKAGEKMKDEYFPSNFD